MMMMTMHCNYDNVICGKQQFTIINYLSFEADHNDMIRTKKTINNNKKAITPNTIAKNNDDGNML